MMWFLFCGWIDLIVCVLQILVVDGGSSCVSLGRTANDAFLSSLGAIG